MDDADTLDKIRAADCLFDQTNSEIIAHLEDGKKELSYLASKSGIEPNEILDKLSYLITHKIIVKSVESNDGIDTVHLFADPDKLSEIVESDGNFDAAVDGLTKMDGYLN